MDQDFGCENIERCLDSGKTGCGLGERGGGEARGLRKREGEGGGGEVGRE